MLLMGQESTTLKLISNVTSRKSTDSDPTTMFQINLQYHCKTTEKLNIYPTWKSKTSQLFLIIAAAWAISDQDLKV